MTQNISTAVREMEKEAARIMDEAKAAASATLEKSREEAKAIASGELPLDDVKAECQAIVEKARGEAAQKVKDAEAAAAEIQSKAAEKTDSCAREIIRIVTGETR